MLTDLIHLEKGVNIDPVSNCHSVKSKSGSKWFLAMEQNNLSVILEVYQNDFDVILKVNQTGFHKQNYILSRDKSH